jgi:hypothetical protein
MTYRWLTRDEVIALDPDLARAGQSPLNPDLSRVLGAFDGEHLVKSLTIQMFPMLGPLITHDNLYRDAGEVSRSLAEIMDNYLQESHARGYLAVCESPVTERICQRHGMKRVESPVYLAVSQVT